MRRGAIWCCAEDPYSSVISSGNAAFVLVRRWNSSLIRSCALLVRSALSTAIQESEQLIASLLETN